MGAGHQGDRIRGRKLTLMKAPSFKYIRADSLDHALDLLADFGEDARVLAGGQSLLPVLNMRLAKPAVLIDINGIASLGGIESSADGLRIGALTRHCEVLASADVARVAPLLSEAMPHVAHPAIRNRGTFGGSLALADPAAEIPAICLALDAVFELRSKRGTRRVPAAEFFLDLYTTMLEPDEILVAAIIPVSDGPQRCAFEELARRRGDYAIVGTGARIRTAPDGSTTVRIAMFGVGSAPILARATARALENRPLDRAALDDAREMLNQDISPMDDIHMSAAAKRYLAGVQLDDVLRRLAA